MYHSTFVSFALKSPLYIKYMANAQLLKTLCKLNHPKQQILVCLGKVDELTETLPLTVIRQDDLIFVVVCSNDVVIKYVVFSNYNSNEWID